MESTSEIVLNEISALQAIFCNHGEFILHSPLRLESKSRTDVSYCFSLNLKCFCDSPSNGENSDAIKVVPLELKVVLPQGYPDLLPQISLSSTQATRGVLSVLQTRLSSFMNTLPEGPRILEIATWLQDQTITNLRTLSSEQQDKSEPSCVAPQRTKLLARLDHVRNRTRYIKTITNWIEELGIGGIMIFSGRLILLFVEGETGGVNEYLRRHKSCKVDVDSSGKPCKERLMNIVIQEKSTGSRLKGLRVVTCSSRDQLQDEFGLIGLEEFYEIHVKPLT